MNEKILNLTNSKTSTASKVFVTGIYGSGKSFYAKTYAKQFGLKYIDFDKYFSYAKINPNISASAEDNFFNILSDRFITDAIPFAENGSSARFIQYAQENAILLVCCVCPKKEVWVDRIKKKEEMKGKKCATVTIMQYADFCSFYYKSFPAYSNLNIEYYDTYMNEYITREQMYERISWLKPLLDIIYEIY